MNPQMSFPFKARNDRVRNTPQSDLDRIPILNQAGNVFSNLARDLVIGLFVVFQERLLMGNDKIHILHVNKAIALEPGAWTN